MSKKKTNKRAMSDEERVIYIDRCTFELQFFRGACGPFVEGTLEEAIEELSDSQGNLGLGIYEKADYLIQSVAFMVLKTLQSPEEVSDYDENSFKEYRRIIRRLGDVKIRYLQQQQRKNKQ